METLQEDIKKAIDSGKLEALTEQLSDEDGDIKTIVKIITTYADAFESEGMSETRALKATLLLLNLHEWKND